MKPPRGLSAEEADAWARLAATVVPMVGKQIDPRLSAEAAGGEGDATEAKSAIFPNTRASSATRSGSSVALQQRADIKPNLQNSGLDSHWERRLRAGTLAPDFTLDLHGHGLDAAHGRLMGGMGQARAMGARVVLLIAGKSRPTEAADRGTQRGAIRAKVLDWLAASSHSSAIAAIRKAHPRHGGEGALYVVLRRER